MVDTGSSLLMSGSFPSAANGLAHRRQNWPDNVGFAFTLASIASIHLLPLSSLFHIQEYAVEISINKDFVKLAIDSSSLFFVGPFNNFIMVVKKGNAHEF